MNNRIIIPWIIAMMIAIQSNAQWTDVSVPTNQYLTNGVFLDDLNGYVSSYSNVKLWKTSDGGVTWDSTDFGETVVDVDFMNPQTGVVLLHGNPEHKIKMTTDGGLNWTYLNFYSGPFENYSGILMKNQNEIFVQSYDFLLKTSNGGVDWDTLYFGGYPFSNDKEKITADTMMFTGWDGTFSYQGAVVRTYDGGNSWAFIPTNDDYTNFAGTGFFSGKKGFGVYSSGWAPDTSYLTYTSDAGNTWNVVHYDTSVTYLDVFMKNETEGYIALTENGAGKIIFTNDGVNYTADYSTPNNFQRFYHASSTLFGIGNNGMVVKKSVPLGISDTEFPELEVYPNPSNDYLKILNIENGELFIYDLSGKIVMQKFVEENEIISITHFSPGIYFLELQNEKGNMTGKIEVIK